MGIKQIRERLVNPKIKLGLLVGFHQVNRRKYLLMLDINEKHRAGTSARK
jgi:hypothetical protein